MPDVKISELPPLAILTAGSLLPVVNAGDTYNVTGTVLNDFILGDLVVIDNQITLNSVSVNVGITDIIYADLYALWSGGTLQAGRFYRITDFRSIYDQPDYSAPYTPKAPADITNPVRPVEPLVVLATSTSSLGNQAWSAQYPEDYIQYNIAFTQTEYKGTPAKGRIVLRVDDAYNQGPYDIRNVVFRRYQDAGGFYTIVYDNATVPKTDIPTFGAECENIRMAQHDSDEVGIDDPPFYATNNIFGDYCESTTTLGDFYNNTIGTFDPAGAYGGAWMYGVSFGHNCHDNRIGDAFTNNMVANEFSNNVIGNDFNNNTIGNGFSNNIIGNSFMCNTIGGAPSGNGFVSNTIGDGCMYNNIGADFTNPDITIGANFSNNMIGPHFRNNVAIGADFTNNNISGFFEGNTVGAGFTMNEIKCAVSGKDLNTVPISFLGITVEYIMTGNGSTLPPTIGQIYAGYFNDSAIPGPFGWIYVGV